MIKDAKYWEEWKDRQIASRPPDFHRNLDIMEAMLEHARLMGAFPPKDPLEGLEQKIRVARILNGLPTSPTA